MKTQCIGLAGLPRNRPSTTTKNYRLFIKSYCKINLKCNVDVLHSLCTSHSLLCPVLNARCALNAPAQLVDTPFGDVVTAEEKLCPVSVTRDTLWWYIRLKHTTVLLQRVYKCIILRKYFYILLHQIICNWLNRYRIVILTQAWMLGY